MDNASNNDTFAATLERILLGQHISFDRSKQRVQYVQKLNLAPKVTEFLSD